MESVPEDMENRRLADLEKFALNHPNHPMVPLLMKQVQRTELAASEVEGGESKEGSWYHWLREQQLQPGRKGKLLQCGRKSGGRKGATNKWDKASSLELLAASKRFQDSLTGLGIGGIRVTSDSRWTTIAQNLPNRYGLEPAKYARSCKVHFMNLCRVYRAEGKNSKGADAIDPQVRRALEEYFQHGDVNVPRRSPPKGFEVKTSVKRVDLNATNVKMSDREDKRSAAMPKAEQNALEKQSKRRPDKVGDPRRIEDTEGVEKISMQNHGEANQDPHEQEEELGNPYQRDQRVSRTIDSDAIIKGWDKASTLQLLAAVRKVGPKVMNRWDAIASQLPNHCKLDNHEYVRSCKEQYRALLSVYTRENMQLDLGHKPLVDEVHVQLEKWLLFNSTTSKANDLRRKEIPCVERTDTALERVGVKPASNPCIIKQNDEEGKGKGIPKAKGGSAEKNREKSGFTKPNSGMRTGNDLEDHTIGLNNGSSRNDAVIFDPDKGSDGESDEYRRRIKKASSEQDGEKQSQTVTKAPPTRSKGFTDAEDRKKNCKLQKGDVKINGIYKTYIDSIVGTSNKLRVRNTFKAAPLNSSGFNQAVNIDKTGSKDNDVQGGYKQQNLKIRPSQPVSCDESLRNEGKLKKQQQPHTKERGFSKPSTHRMLPDQAKKNDSNSSEAISWLLEQGGIERGENSKGRKRGARDGDVMTSAKFESLDTEIGDKKVSTMWGTAERIIDPRTDTFAKNKAPLLYNSDSSRIQGAESDKVRSRDDSIHSKDSFRGDATYSTMIRNKSALPKLKTKTNISCNGSRIFSSGPQSNKPLHADKREVETNPAADRLENRVGVDRRLRPPFCRKFKLGSDQDERSCDDSLHLDEDDSASQGDESKRKRTKRLLIMNRMLKKRAERNKADNNRVG